MVILRFVTMAERVSDRQLPSTTLKVRQSFQLKDNYQEEEEERLTQVSQVKELQQLLKTATS